MADQVLLPSPPQLVHVPRGLGPEPLRRAPALPGAAAHPHGPGRQPAADAADLHPVLHRQPGLPDPCPSGGGAGEFSGAVSFVPRRGQQTALQQEIDGGPAMLRGWHVSHQGGP